MTMLSRVRRNVLLSLFVGLVLPLGVSGAEVGWPAVTKETRPWTYWWWLGSAADEGNITWQLEQFAEKGMGGVHIIPIYGTKGYEETFIPFLSEKWLEMVHFTVTEAERLGMGVDMTTGTGWPFGGPMIGKDWAAKKVEVKEFAIKKGERIEERFTKGWVEAVMAYASDGVGVIDLTGQVDEDGRIDWVGPDGEWMVYVVVMRQTGQKVKRAAPGCEGFVLDPFSKDGMEGYLAAFDKAMDGSKGAWPRAQYHDSYEYFGADWTAGFFEKFKERRGYDLRLELGAFNGKGDVDRVARVKSDYRETIADLLLEDFTEPWVRWSREKGYLVRNEAHGSPGNLLDLYGAADAAETEAFGPSQLAIPGLRIDTDYNQAPVDWFFLRFASSASHVMGHRFVTSESCTWLGEHFKVGLPQIKPEIDRFLTAGVNHVFYHGMAYTVKDAAWPGWQFYASTSFSPTNSLWRDIDQLNTYIGRCQAVLQSGVSDSDVLVYYPAYDVWHDTDGRLIPFRVHNVKDWLTGERFYEVVTGLWDAGYASDYVSDRQLSLFAVKDGAVVNDAGSRYAAVIVPGCERMPVETMKELVRLATAGATVIFDGAIPEDVPGLGEYELRREALKTVVDEGSDAFVVSDDVVANVKGLGRRGEAFSEKGLRWIRRRGDEGYWYFVSNLGARAVDGWVTLGVDMSDVEVYTPMDGEMYKGMARAETDEVYVQLKPGQSVVLRTLDEGESELAAWKAIEADGVVVPVEGEWTVDFVDGGPVLPNGYVTEELASWTDRGDPDLQRLAGTGRYQITFTMDDISGDEWVLSLGKVCESGRVKLNGKDVGVLWSIPFECRVGEFLQKGENVLEVEVTNLAANRIRDVDQRGENWKRFYDINFVNIGYKKFDASGWELVESGLLGPVRLVRQRFVD